jgi:hypothetical protein
VLLHLAVVLNPESLRLRKRRDRYARFALAAALGYLLLIPLHLGATLGTFNNQNSNGQEQQRLQGQEAFSLQDSGQMGIQGVVQSGLLA